MFDKTKLISGLVLIAGIILIALINDMILNTLIFMIVLFLGFNEAKKLFNTPNASVILALIAFVVASINKESIFMALLLICLVLGLSVYKKEENLKVVLPYLYPTLPLFALWQVYLDGGIFALFWLVVIVALCDSGAYFIGKLIGSTPFSPTSPNKTLEGVIGGMTIASIFGTLFGLFEYNFLLSLVISFSCAVLAVIGDLLESYFKRQAGLKDSGDLIPGHGGILDRIDAIIIASIAMVILI